MKYVIKVNNFGMFRWKCGKMFLVNKIKESDNEKKLFWKNIKLMHIKLRKNKSNFGNRLFCARIF